MAIMKVSRLVITFALAALLPSLSLGKKMSALRGVRDGNEEGRVLGATFRARQRLAAKSLSTIKGTSTTPVFTVASAKGATFNTASTATESTQPDEDEVYPLIDDIEFDRDAKEAGLVFPVDQIDQYLRETSTSPPVGKDVSVFLAAIVEALSKEVLVRTVAVARSDDRLLIKPETLFSTVKGDDDLETVFGESVVLTDTQINFSPSIGQMLKLVDPGIGISKGAMVILNSMITDVFERLAADAEEILSTKKKETLSGKDMKDDEILSGEDMKLAARDVLTAALAERSIDDGAKALKMYTSSGGV